MKINSNIDSQVVDKLAQKIWDYHHLHHELKKADCILVCGSHDLRVAERATQIYLEGWAPFMIFTGGLGRHTENWQKTEAETFALIARKMGIPKSKILIENKSTNTGDNFKFSEKLLKDRKLYFDKYILVHKPYMERRAYATAKKVWPDKKIIITSPVISFQDYPTENIPKNKVINIMVGDLQRIKLYSQKGYQIYQRIPKDVWRSYEKLVSMGFDKELV